MKQTNNNHRGIKNPSNILPLGTGTRHSSISNATNNNIHININLNVKKKSSNCSHQIGKKINNFIQISSSKNKLNNDPSNINENVNQNKVEHYKQALGKSKKSISTKQGKDDKNEIKIKKKNTKTKQKIVSKPFTPQKRQKSKQTSFSKSKTGKKIQKKRQSKSMQNLKAHFKQKNLFLQNTNKLNGLNIKQNNEQKQKSTSKQRSRSKSTKKLNKHIISSKNMVNFENSGIKKSLLQKDRSKSQYQTSDKLKKSKKSLPTNKLPEQDMIKIHQFMQDKKRKQKKQAHTKQKQKQLKAIKIKQQLLKVEIQRKQNITKPYKRLHDEIGLNDRIRLPMYFGEDDQFKQQQDYQQLRRQLNQVVDFSKTNFHNQSNGFNQRITKSNSFHSSNKNYRKTQKLQSVYQKYKKGSLSSSKQVFFIKKVVKIQAFWRGYYVRKTIFEEISKINNVANGKRKQIYDKKSKFWNDDMNNSIIKLKSQDQYIQSSRLPIKNRKIGHDYDWKQQYRNQKPLNLGQIKTPIDSKYNSSQVQQHHTDHKKYDSSSSKSESQKVMNQVQINKSENNEVLNRKIQMLRKQMEDQNFKFQKLERQNQALKANLDKVHQENSNQQSPLMNQPLDQQSVQFYKISPQIKKNAQISAQINNSNSSNQLIPSNRFKKNLQIQIIEANSEAIKSPSNLFSQSLKQKLQTYQSPSNRSLASLSRSNMNNLQKAFKKKQLLIDQVYQKNSKTYSQMFMNNLVSPKTYNIKKIQLDQKYKQQKQQINTKLKQAEKVMQFITQDVQQDFSTQKKLTSQPKLQPTTQQLVISINHNQPQNQNQESDINQEEDINQTRNNFTNYWLDDMEDVHQKALQISKKIDLALAQDENSDSYISSSNQNYSSLNSNHNHQRHFSDQLYQSTNRQQSIETYKNTIYQQNQYTISQPNKKHYQPAQEEIVQLMTNNSNVSTQSEKSSNHSANYDIHYPNLAQSNKMQLQNPKNIIQMIDPSVQQQQNQIQSNCSGLSQSKSLLSQGTIKVQRGFDTRLTFIKQYCIALCQFIRSQQVTKFQFIQNISNPIQYSPLEVLKSYRTTVTNEHNTKYNNSEIDYIYPFFKIIRRQQVKALEDSVVSNFQQLYSNDNDLNQQMTQLRNYFIKAIVDVFNQALHFERPGSIYGEQMPWMAGSKHLKNNHVKTLYDAYSPDLQQASQGYSQYHSQVQDAQDDRLNRIFGIAIAKIIQWGSCLCGFIPQPVSFDCQQIQAANIDQQQTNIVRQTRLAYMLEKSLVQEEQLMIDNGMEQVEVILQIQRQVYQDIVQEMAKDLQKIAGFRQYSRLVI